MNKRTASLIMISLMILMKVKAENLDLTSHDLLIQKLEFASSISKSDSSVLQLNLQHRLADLYAERARLLSIEDKGQDSKALAEKIESDRQHSILILKKIIPLLSRLEKGSALLQVAHLYELMSQKNQALKIVEDIEKNQNQYDEKTNSLALIKLGDYFFITSQFEKSQTRFENALKLNKNPRQGYCLFRLAWIQYNRGQTQQAEKSLIQILQNQNLLISKNGQLDESFQEEISHDLATFMAHNDLKQSSLRMFLKLTAQNGLQKNLIYLAKELDRTAKKESAVKVWNLVGIQKLSYEDQLERQLSLARIEYDLSHEQQLLKQIDLIIQLIENPQNEASSAIESIRTVAIQNLRKLIADWARAEQRTTSINLIRAFQKFSLHFQDAEISYWGATLAYKVKQYNEAFIFYHQSIQILKQFKIKTPQQNKMFEDSLIGSIEVASFSKDPQLKIEAYKIYLEYNPQGQQKNEVRYQIAHWYYDQNDYVTAQKEFVQIALDKTVSTNLREKSADLCLDIDVLLKNEAQIENDALSLSMALESKKTEYLAIWRKSILNQTAYLLNHQKNLNEYETELQKLNQISIVTFQHDEKKKYLNHKIQLAFRLKKIDQFILYSKVLLNSTKLNEPEHFRALTNLAWASEFKMNFKESLSYLKELEPITKNKADHFLKVALLQELIFQNPYLTYKEVLNSSKVLEQKQFAAYQLVLNSKQPEKDFKIYKNLLAQNPELFRSVVLFISEKNHSDPWAEPFLKNPAFKNTLEFWLLTNSIQTKKYLFNQRQITHMNLRSKSDQTLKKSTLERTKALSEIERLANVAIAQKNTTLQILYFKLLAHEYKRLAEDIKHLAVPKKLSSTEKKNYELQINQLIKPYEEQSIALVEKSKEIWTKSLATGAFDRLIELSIQRKKPGSTLAVQELSLLKSSARELGLPIDHFENLSETRQKMSFEVSELQKSISEKPFNFDYLDKMKTLQMRLGSGPMVAYLDLRMNDLKSMGVQ